MELEVGACKMYIKETTAVEVSIALEGECEDHYRYASRIGNTLLLVHKDMSYDALDTIWRGAIRGAIRNCICTAENAWCLMRSRLILEPES